MVLPFLSLTEKFTDVVQSQISIAHQQSQSLALPSYPVIAEETLSNLASID